MSIYDDVLSCRYAEKIHYISRNQHLDILIHDRNPDVRIAMAKQGKKLSSLINDDDWQVRREVAYKGYGLNILIGDEHKFVRNAVIYYCKRNLENEECKNILKLYNL